LLRWVIIVSTAAKKINSDIPCTSGVYAIKNSKNKKVYVGSSVNMKKRINDHFRELKQDKHHSSKLQRAYNRAEDKSIFVPTVLELVVDRSDLYSREQYWIDKYDAFNVGYNCSALADNPNYTITYDKKKKSESKCAVAYEKFWSVYDAAKVKMGHTLLSRIRNKHYKFPAINAMSSLLDYLMVLYASANYIFYIGYRNNSLYMDVYASDGDRFVEYGWKNESPYIVSEATDMIRAYLSRNGLLNDSLHTILQAEGGGNS
jgi:group I intron endonuclease